MAGKALGPSGFALGTGGETLQQIKEALLTSFEVLAYGALLLLLPCAVAGLFFDCFLTEILVQVMLVSVAGTAILTTIAIHEGWYLEHLSDWGIDRNRMAPGLPTKSPSSQGGDDGEARSG
jgi:hypothetical protein